MKNPKRKLKILLSDLTHDYLSENCYVVVPLNIGYIAAYLNDNFESEVEIKLFKSPGRFLENLKTESAVDVFGFSSYGWNQELNNMVINKVSVEYPEAIICSGGPHIRTDQKGIAQYLAENPNIDYHCIREGEYALGSLIEYFLANGTTKPQFINESIPGVAYLKDGDLRYKNQKYGERLIDDIPSPYLSGVLDEFLIHSTLTPLLESNRGCPFRCSFCAWGVSARDKVRIFHLDQVLEEIRYVAKLSSASRWILADANFGLLERDIEIAREFKKVSEQYSHLRNMLAWNAKNSPKRIIEISEILGTISIPLLAVQSFDDEVLRNIRRDNKNNSATIEVLRYFQSKGFPTSTDLLLGLPGESYASHLETLQKAFSVGFDFIYLSYIRMLPGSELETDESRSEFGLKTKHRLIHGHYGIYDDKHVFEFEESIISSKDISEKEMLSLRLVHFFVWALWNLGIAKPLLKWQWKKQNRSPLDTILFLTKPDKNLEMNEFISEFNKDAVSEWFDTPEALKTNYNERFEELLKNGFLKMNLKYVGRILSDKNFAWMLLNGLIRDDQHEIVSEMIQFCFDRIFFVEDGIQSKECKYSVGLIECLKELYPDETFDSSTCHFEIDNTLKEEIETLYNKEMLSLMKTPMQAIANTLEGFHVSVYLYDYKFR